MTERLGIEIDYCPRCRGVWLDRGELDKIIERSTGELVQRASVTQFNNQPSSHHDSNHGYSDQHNNDHQGYRGKQPFWKELFD
jgi:Zn-finger nucleic acid-binding protein